MSARFTVDQLNALPARHRNAAKAQLGLDLQEPPSVPKPSQKGRRTIEQIVLDEEAESRVKLRFEIDCVPPKATAQQQKTAVIGGRVRKYDPKNVSKAKSDMLDMLAPHAPPEPLEGPLALSVVWTYPYRKSDSKKTCEAWQTPCDKRPDCSNLVKAFEDAMTKAGFWNDDGQIADLRFRKYWGRKPGIFVIVERAV